jgi:hypothetical protein
MYCHCPLLEQVCHPQKRWGYQLLLMLLHVVDVVFSAREHEQIAC